MSCILRHQGVQLILAYSWARPAILVAGKGRWGIFLFLLFLHFHSCSFLPCPSFSSSLLSLLSLFSLSLGDDTKWRTRVDVSLHPNTINHLTATETALNTVGTHYRQISPKTVGCRLREIGLRARRPYVGLPLTQARRLCRMAWLTAHAPRLFPMRQWRRVLFTDESRFTLYRADGRRRVYRSRRERFADACVVERDRFGGWLRYGLGRHCSRDKITADYCCGQYDRSKV